MSTTPKQWVIATDKEGNQFLGEDWADAMAQAFLHTQDEDSYFKSNKHN